MDTICAAEDLFEVAFLEVALSELQRKKATAHDTFVKGRDHWSGLHGSLQAQCKIANVIDPQAFAECVGGLL